MVDVAGAESEQTIRRRDLRDLGEAFRKALTPLSGVLDHMKGLNARWDRSGAQMRSILRLQFLLLALSVVSLLAVGWAIHVMDRTRVQMDASALKMHQLDIGLASTLSELRELKSTASNTEAAVKQVKQAEEDRPKLELVAETDPVKAVSAPMKLRVTNAAPSAAPSSSGDSVFSRVPLLPSPAADAPAMAEIPIPRRVP